MAVGNAAATVLVKKEAGSANAVKTFLSRYFYLCMGLLMAVLVVWGFSHTVNDNLFHANPPRPWLLWMHGAAFSTWIVLFITQSALVRVRKVSVHRSLGWFGAGLAAAMVVLGFTIAVMMNRFDSQVLHQKDIASFLSVPFEDIVVFGTLMALAIYWRKKPDYHRRLVFIATCVLMDAAIGRFDFWDRHHIYYLGLDLLIVLGMVRDWVVERRVHKVYLYALPPIIVMQSVAMYAYRANPAWWQAATHAIPGW